MTKYNLTPRQEELLKSIIDQMRAGTAKEPFTPIVYGTGANLMGIQGNFDRNLKGDLEILVEEGLLSSRPTSKGNLTYSVKKSAYDAVDNNFEMPEKSLSNQYIGTIIGQMNGGNVQSTAYSNQSEITQIVSDPTLLEKTVNELTNNLLEIIKSELSADKLVSYIKITESLKEEINSEKPSSSKIQGLINSLAFMGDVEGTLSLISRVWPYIYPIVIIAAQKIMSGN